VVGLELFREMEEKMMKIKQNLKVARDKKKNYADKGRTHREFKVGDHVFLKVKSNRISMKLGNFSKMEAHYYGSFEIVKRIGPIAYMFSLSASMCLHNVFHASFLKKYVPDVNHVIDWNVIRVEKEGNFQVHLVCILDRKIKQLQNQVVGLVKVQWVGYGIKDAT
jgi:hypothetical protein